jgi:hypothetical protein
VRLDFYVHGRAGTWVHVAQFDAPGPMSEPIDDGNYIDQLKNLAGQVLALVHDVHGQPSALTLDFENELFMVARVGAGRARP